MARALALPRPFRRAEGGGLWNHFVFWTVATLVLLPTGFLIVGSFSTARLPTEFSLDQMGWANHIKVWTDPVTWGLFYNTFVYVGGSTAFGITVAAVLAWLVERSDMPGKIWIYAGVPLTLAVPGLLQSMAWVLLLSPRSGFINRFLIDTLGLDAAPVDIYSLGGMIFVEGLRLVPTAFLMLVPLLRAMDPALEEAAAVSGARPARAVRRVTLGLMAPGLVAVVIYQAMTALEVFEVPGVLGLPANIHVFSTQIYAILQTVELPAVGEANALAMLYLLIAIVAIYFYSRMIGRAERFSVITGKGYRPRPVALGRWRHVCLALVFVFLILSVILPFLVLLYVSFLPVLQPPSLEAFRAMSFEQYREIFTYDRFRQTFTNTLLMVFVAATATTVLSFLISLVVVRSKFFARRLLDQIAFIPHAIPGIVMGIAFLWLYLLVDQKLGTGFFGSIWSIAIGFTVAFIAYGTRSMNAAILQVHHDLEEAATTSGAPPWRVMIRIFVPLMLPTFAGVWIWVVLLTVRVAGMPLVLFEGPDNEVLAVLIWYMWDEGDIEAVGAIGAMLMASLLLLTLGVRFLGFGRGPAQN
ncbi:MAG: ABC transporter permease subunit [Alphaproteobacteria bacterium]|nr:ABC transporter permease subunit [Alphaproteobacteria bacterium]